MISKIDILLFIFIVGTLGLIGFNDRDYTIAAILILLSLLLFAILRDLVIDKTDSAG